MENINIPEIFGCNVFSDAVMKERLPESVYTALKRTIDEGEELTLEIAEVVAQAMKKWAIEKGATHFTHWFQPMTGSTAEKHDAFITSVDSSGRAILEFSGKMLIKGEADGSSFPSGGLRATFEARGYTTWDCTSPAFVRQDNDGTTVLCIPTAFCSFTGEALDEKTPLLRSMEALSRQAVRVLHHMGLKEVKRVTPTVGGEQEYFLIDKRFYNRRKDLVYTGRTLFGAQPARGQELEDQYYASISERISKYMRELNIELWKLGVTAKTQHNEVAPSQYELAPLFSNANIAVDHNQIIMEMMQKVASRNGFICLLHEKPYKGVNGSGKHNNWSLQTNTGINLLKPAKVGSNNMLFLTFLIATLSAVDKYAKVLRMSCATPSNQFRLGGNEAPPSIISAYVGTAIMSLLEKLENGDDVSLYHTEKMSMGVSTLAAFHKDESDRNRTSPFAFTGNKFEFRMVGSSQSLGMPNTALNTIVAQELMEIADRLDNAANKNEELLNVLKDLLREHKRIVFNGNNYSAEWHEEASKRGLPIINSVVEATNVMADKDVVDLFSRHSVFDAAELAARREIALHSYIKHTQIEAVTMLKLSKQKLYPACIKYSKLVAESLTAIQQTGVKADLSAFEKTLADVCASIASLKEKIEILDGAVANVSSAGSDVDEQAVYYRDHVCCKMEDLRAVVDAMEKTFDKEIWPLPSYGEMMFNII